jgi:deazaflavin-dependent oxidoreductase (nitroreductase family)
MTDMNDYNAKVIEEFRSNGGVAMGGAMTMALITTTGAKSGQQRTNPVACRVGEDGVLYVFASKGGAPSHPDWYHNLLANPKLVVEFGTERYDAIATPLTGDARDALYAAQVEAMPVFGEYQSKTDRVIPVVELRRA